MRNLASGFYVTLFAVPMLHAQLVNDGATNTLSNVTNVIPSMVTVGTNGSFTLLVLSTDCLLTNSGLSEIGRNASARSNEVRLVSPTARWRMLNPLAVGLNGSFNRLTISNGATVSGSQGNIGNNGASASNNTVLVNGAGSSWSIATDLQVGLLGGGSRLEISDGGFVTDDVAYVGNVSLGNQALVTGANSLWSNRTELTIGSSRGGNQLLVNNGGTVVNSGGFMGRTANGTNNLAVISGPGSLWNNRSNLHVGSSGGRNLLIVSNSATVIASNLFVGFNATSTNNRVVVDGGTLYVTNVAGTGTLDIRRGTNTLIAGLIEVDRLLVTNSQGSFVFTGGTLSSKSTTATTGFSFSVGNNNGAATFILAGNGAHSFGTGGLTIFADSVLTGNGSISGNTLLAIDSILSPGAPIGTLSFSSPPLLSGRTLMELSSNGTVLTNDRVVVTGTITYGGSLIATNIGPTALTIGNRFQLFSAGSYAGSFSTITLPPLFPGLIWTNRLNVDGSIEVLGEQIPTLQMRPATNVTFSSAVLNGRANPNGLTTRAWFEWGITTNYGNSTSSHALGSTGNFQNFSETITGLVEGVVYHFRAAASNSLGITVFGEDQSFGTVTLESGLITYLKASNTQSNGSDSFGFSVAMSGDTVVVGAPFEDSNATGVNGDQGDNSAESAGAAYVFVRNGTNWSQQAYLKASNTATLDQFGYAVAISGDTIVVTARGEDSGATGVNGNGNDDSVPESGAAYVFVRSGTTWTQQAYLKASNPGANDVFGNLVAISADSVVVGAPSEDSNATGVNGNGSDNSSTDSGAAYVFVRNGTNWVQQAYLKPSNTALGKIFGASVSISGDTLVAGSRFEDSILPNSGAAYVFARSGTNWTQQALLKASNVGQDDSFGRRVAISGNTVLVGAELEDSSATGVNGNGTDDTAFDSGAAYVFVRNGTNWTQQAYLKASNTETNDNFGLGAVAVSGDVAIVGAQQEDSAATGMDGDENNNGAVNPGAAYVFVRSGTNWTQRSYLKASNTGTLDRFGFAVSVSGNTVVVAADVESSNATGINGNQSDDSAAAAGAVYVFDLSQPLPLLSILPGGIGQVTLSWAPPIPGFALQESLSLAPVNWSNSPSGPTNPISLPTSGSTRFFRLFQP